MLDEDHARLVGRVGQLLREYGWLVQTEITYAHYGEHGSYDILAFHPQARVLLVVEVKTDLPSAEATIRKLDEKVRLAPAVASERFGWQARNVSRVIVMTDNRTLRRRVERNAGLLRAAFPQRSIAVKRWIAAPNGAMSGIWFLTDTNRGSAIQKPGGRSRVRVARRVPGTNGRHVSTAIS